MQNLECFWKKDYQEIFAHVSKDSSFPQESNVNYIQNDEIVLSPEELEFIKKQVEQKKTQLQLLLEQKQNEIQASSKKRRTKWNQWSLLYYLFIPLKLTFYFPFK